MLAPRHGGFFWVNCEPRLPYIEVGMNCLSRAGETRGREVLKMLPVAAVARGRCPRGGEGQRCDGSGERREGGGLH